MTLGIFLHDQIASLLLPPPQVLYNFFLLYSPMLASVISKSLRREELRSYREACCWQHLLVSSCDPSSEAFVGTIGSQPSLLKGVAVNTIPGTSQDNWILAVVPAFPSYCVCHLCTSAFSPHCDLALMQRGTMTAKPLWARRSSPQGRAYVLLTLALKALH